MRQIYFRPGYASNATERLNAPLDASVGCGKRSPFRLFSLAPSSNTDDGSRPMVAFMLIGRQYSQSRFTAHSSSFKRQQYSQAAGLCAVIRVVTRCNCQLAADTRPSCVYTSISHVRVDLVSQVRQLVVGRTASLRFVCERLDSGSPAPPSIQYLLITYCNVCRQLSRHAASRPSSSQTALCTVPRSHVRPYVCVSAPFVHQSALVTAE